MNIIQSLKNRKTPMRRRLFTYMLALAIIVLFFLACGLFFLGHFTSSEKKAESSLSYQMQTYERQISKYFEDLTRMGNSLSESVARKTENYLAEHLPKRAKTAAWGLIQIYSHSAIPRIQLQN